MYAFSPIYRGLTFQFKVYVHVLPSPGPPSLLRAGNLYPIRPSKADL